MRAFDKLLLRKIGDGRHEGFSINLETPRWGVPTNDTIACRRVDCRAVWAYPVGQKMTVGSWINLMEHHLAHTA